MTFHQLFLHPLDLPSTSVDFPSISGTINQQSVHQWDLSSTFSESAGPALNFPRIRGTFRQPLSTFCASAGHSVNFLFIRGTFRQLSVRPLGLPSSFCKAVVSFVYFCQLSVCLWGILWNHHASAGPPSTFRTAAWPSINFNQLYVRPRKLPSTFGAATGPSINFRQLLYILGTFRLTFHWTVGSSITFSQISVRCIRQLVSTFRAAAGPSVNFLCVCTTFRQLPISFYASAGPYVNFWQISLTLRERPSTSVKFPWVHGIFRQHSLHPWDLLLTFRVSTVPAINLLWDCGTLCQLSVHPRDLLSTFCACAGPWVDFRELLCIRGPSVNFLCFHRAFYLLSVWQRDFPSSSNIFPYIRGILCQLPLTFRASAVLSINSRKHFMHPQDLP